VSLAKELTALTHGTPQAAEHEGAAPTGLKAPRSMADPMALPRADGAEHNQPGATPGRKQWPLLIGLSLVFFTLLALYCAVLSVLLPNQIEIIDRAHKAGRSGGRVCDHLRLSTLTTPSRVRSRQNTLPLGTRHAWIVWDRLVALLASRRFTNARAVVHHGVLGRRHVGLTVQSALHHRSSRPTFRHRSGASVRLRRWRNDRRRHVGIVLAGHLAWKSPSPTCIALAIASSVWAFVIVNPEPPLTAATPDALTWVDFSKLLGRSAQARTSPGLFRRFTSTWISGIVTYLLYILQDYSAVHRSIQQR